ncbi:predicted beta-xyloside ABC transporter, permease component [Paenibacillus sp. JCM 10914]|nr:predicted beta-xyloside ABC transporter, permease component [Paenibacillus sp. JCM 10914]
MAQVELEGKTEPLSRRGPLRRFLKQWDIQLMVLPAMMFILVFSYVPMYGVLMAFQDYSLFKGFMNSPWVGLKHFEMFFQAPEFWTVIRNTLVISALKLCIGFPAPILLALMLNEVGRRSFKRLIQTISYLPHFLSWVIVSGFVISILSTDNGSLNILLQKLNLIEDPVNFLSEQVFLEHSHPDQCMEGDRLLLDRISGGHCRN